MAPGRISADGEELVLPLAEEQSIREPLMQEGEPHSLNGLAIDGVSSPVDGPTPRTDDSATPPLPLSDTTNGNGLLPQYDISTPMNGNGTHTPASSNGSSTPLTAPSNGTASPRPDRASSLNDAPEPKPSVMPIAIIGLSVRAGSASTADEFFSMLSRSRSAFVPNIPSNRFSNAPFYHPNPGKLGGINTNGASFIQQDITKFDAPFFSITELEATSLDPQQRLLLECAFEALESGGVPKASTVGGDVGVFMGAGTPEYEVDLFRDSETMPMFQATGESLCALALWEV